MNRLNAQGPVAAVSRRAHCLRAAGSLLRATLRFGLSIKNLTAWDPRYQHVGGQVVAAYPASKNKYVDPAPVDRVELEDPLESFSDGDAVTQSPPGSGVIATVRARPSASSSRLSPRVPGLASHRLTENDGGFEFCPIGESRSCHQKMFSLR